MKQSQAFDVGFSFLCAAEFQRQQLHSDLLHEPDQTLLISENDRHDRD